MPRFVARRDDAAGCFYIHSVGGFAPPEDVRRVFKAHRGAYSAQSQAWQMPLSEAESVFAAIRTGGHFLEAIDPNAPRPVAVLQECGNPDCRQPYRAGYENRLGLDCKACGQPLVLVHAHTCDDVCRENAVPAKAAAG